MKKICAALLCVVLAVMVLMTGCVRESAYQTTGTPNVSMVISNVMPSGATVTIHDSNPEPFVYGSWYQIEQEKDGIWYEVKTKIKDYGFDEMGWLTDDQGALTMTVDWEWLYGKLPQGHYRILKQAGTQMISAEFTVG